MSAFMVDPEHIHVLVWAAVHSKPTEPELHTYTRDEPTPYNAVEESGWSGEWNVRRLRKHLTETAYGQFLVDANAASVNRRYDEDHAYIYEYRTPTHTQWQPVEILNAINCFEYQACEVEDWASSEAKQFCDRLRRRIEERLPNASNGPWEIRPDVEPATVRARREAQARMGL
ncbi:hypothetical protein ACPW96_21385 [Micromonospora sp. DT81.3]|uniref:hypothetical protein n=1 Tax=Micromonospora sp. DT81.3 TaxID=3416523 RepID=UPI003CF91DFC